ncbi:MAG: (2Fe-2S)-binding protein [Bdellovibrio sp.]|nr:(2Fe-2S)-binding protein [Bdellovibrio sp.]
MTDLNYYNAQSCDVNGIKVLLDISFEQKILNVKVISSLEIDQRFKNLLMGRGLDVAMKLTGEELGRENSFLVLELELLQEAVLNFIGVPRPDALEKGHPPQELVCRCFGVYQSDINSFIKGNEISDLNLVHLTEELNAGAACGSCLKELKFYLEEGKQRYLPFPAKSPVDAAGRRLRIKGLTPKEMAELLSKYLSEKNIEVMSIRPPFVLIRSKGTTLSSIQLRELADWIEEKLSVRLEFRVAADNQT